jgi:hypothetical protein
VISGLAGEAKRLIDAFARDEIEQYRFLPCRGRRGRGPGATWLRQCHHAELQELRRRKGAKPCRDTTEPVRLGPDRARGGGLAGAADPRTERRG